MCASLPALPTHMRVPPPTFSVYSSSTSCVENLKLKRDEVHMLNRRSQMPVYARQVCVAKIHVEQVGGPGAAYDVVLGVVPFCPSGASGGKVGGPGAAYDVTALHSAW